MPSLPWRLSTEGSEVKFSFSTNAFVRHSVFEAVETIAGIGYDGVEILADTPHLYALSVTKEDVERLQRVLGRTGLAVANINANTVAGYYGRSFWEPLFEPSLANPDEDARAWRVNYTKRCIDLAREFGSTSVSVTSGRMVPGTPPEEALKFLTRSLKDLIPYAEERGVKIGIEYEPGLLIECCDELAVLLDEVDSSWLGANWDIGHSHVAGEEPEAVLASLSSRVFHVHLEDIRGRKHYHRIPGEGDLDINRIFRALKGAGYDRLITVELYTYPNEPEEAGRRALAHLRGLSETQS
jgi:sugar phosphate isomerase/epimerase